MSSEGKWAALWRKPDVRARLALLLTSLSAFPELLSFSRIFVPDDGFTSDIFNGEMPARALLGGLLREGQFPSWTHDLGGGYPIGAGALGDLWGLLTFAAFSPAAALCVYLLGVLWLAAQGTYSFARRSGASPVGAVFAGTAFVSGGYIVSQLRHLSVLGSVAWFPWELFFLDRALRGELTEQRSLAWRLEQLAYFGLCLAAQANAGFPQTAYISLLCAGIYAIAIWGFRLYRWRNWRHQLILAGAACIVVGLGVSAGALTMLPLKELAESSGRSSETLWQFVATLRYRWIDALNFLWPDINGDAATATNTSLAPFWETYGYSGVLTVALALGFLLLAARRVGHVALVAMAGFSFLMVLGPSTPLFKLFWNYLPGLSSFRFPTRFLFVTCFSLSIFSGLGLTHLQRLSLRKMGSQRLPRLALSWTALLVLCADLFVQQRTQNPFVDAERWLSPPGSVVALQHAQDVRVHSLGDRFFHQLAFVQASGWSDVEPYFRLRGALAPNLPALYGIAAIDVYSGAAPGSWANLWGDHMHQSLIPQTWLPRAGAVLVRDAYLQTLELFGVNRILSVVPLGGSKRLSPAGRFADGTFMYELHGSRARCFHRAELALSDKAAVKRMVQPEFLERDTLQLHEQPQLAVPVSSGAEQTQLEPTSSTTQSWAATRMVAVRELSNTSVELDVQACAGGYVFLGDTWYPGWTASVDGQYAAVSRANVAGRAVRIPVGAQRVRMQFRSSSIEIGLVWTLASLALLVFGAFVMRRLHAKHV